jgi:hypothetical protein
MWQSSVFSTPTNGGVFILNGPVGTIVDVDLELAIQNGEAAETATGLGVSLTTGVVYYNTLDNGAASGANLLSAVSAQPLL